MHTPGPWSINGSLVTAQAGMALQVASVSPPKIGNAPRDMAERDANAKLIAAAPDLLAALKAVLFAQQHLIGHFYEEDMAAVDKAYAAIKKAGA